LWKGLLGRGHKVICFSPDPTITPKGGFHISTGEALSTVGVDWIGAEKAMLEKCEPYLADFDIIHEHNWFGHAYACKSRNPRINVCHTHHGHVSYDWWGKSPPPFKLNFIGISKWMKHCYETGYDGKAPAKIPAEYAYNGIDLESYPFKKEKGDRLMFLGRIDPIKMPHAAIDVAEKTQTPIDIVGGTSFVANTQYVLDIKARCQQSLYANFLGEVNHAAKLELLQNAKALLIPSKFGEPFGLIAVEAMACGTVPIALNDGALSEIITHGESGFIAESVDEIVELVSQTETITSENCRNRARRFSKERCAERYEELYKRAINEGW